MKAPTPSAAAVGDAPAPWSWPCPISVVVPTRNEVDSLPVLLERLAAVRAAHDLELEVLLMDDDSRDGSREFVANAGHEWVQMVVRREKHGLGRAVAHGIALARFPVIVVMHADSSHPPERIPELVRLLLSGREFVTASPPGRGQGLVRWVSQKLARLLARPLTQAENPTAGFFAIRKADAARAKALRPIGPQVGLELIVRCGLVDIGHLAIERVGRQRGSRQLTLGQRLRYLQHLRRLYTVRFGTWSHLFQFLVVGLSGVVVNLAFLTIFVWLSIPQAVAVGAAIFVSMCTNFVLNRRFAFDYARREPIVRQFVGFALAASLGALINFAVTLYVSSRFASLPIQLAAMAGILAGMSFNFVASRYLVFRKLG